MRFELLVLGANSAGPMPGRFPSSFVLNHNEELFLLDCGEGAQIKMSQFGVKRSRINNIFISHLHGDHIFGLPGFLNSYSLNHRSETLHLFGPEGLRDYISAIQKATGAVMSYELDLHEISRNNYHKIYDSICLEIFAFPLKHRIQTFAYKFVEKSRPLNIDPEAIRKYSLTIEEIIRLKSGKDIHRGKKVLNHRNLTFERKPSRTFVYCSDTIYDPSIVNYLTHADLIYHEATYLDDLKDKAHDRMHSTVLEAAEIARQAGVKKLLIGHYSSRYKKLDPLLSEAKSHFENTQIALEGQIYTV